jgi:carboxypeptidase Q
LRLSGIVVLVLLLVFPAVAADTLDASRAISDAALASGESWEVLSYLADVIGPRLSGSEGAERAVEWTAETMRNWGLFVRLQPVTVPVWVRGEERASLVSHGNRAVHVTALGPSVATPAAGIEAEVIAASSLEQLVALGDAVRGKIVLVNEVMDPVLVSQHRSFEAYGPAVRQRGSGAAIAGRQGAVACVIRSVTTRSLRTPHTGAMRYDSEGPRIPAGAVSTEDADLIQRLLDRGETVRMRLVLTPKSLPDTRSANVIAEIPGRERPEEIVVIGGHLDSWDLGTGAIDNGAGIAVTMETMRLIHQLGLQPRRTIRAVLFMNEENGLRGALAYRKSVTDELWRHVAAVEFDAGVGRPMAYRTTLSIEEIARLEPWLVEMRRLGAGTLIPSPGTGADTSPLTRSCVTGFGAAPENDTYFDYHHSAADTLDKVDPELLRRNAATFAVLTWILADMPQRVDGR